MIGASLNQYQITARLGAGGMGEVFRARDTRLNRDVAIKMLPRDVATDGDRLRRFEQEAKTLAALNHPNILTLHDAGVRDGTAFLVSELLEGKTLREELCSGALPVRKARDYALQIAQGLAAAHGKGIIHRDLKPENLFVARDGRVKILDFGLAKLLENQKAESRNSRRTLTPRLWWNRPNRAKSWARQPTCPPNRCEESRRIIGPTSLLMAACFTKCSAARAPFGGTPRSRA